MMQAVQAREAHWAQALSAGDLDALAALYEPGAWLVVPGAPPFRGRSAIRSALEDMAAHTASIELATTTVEPAGQDYLIENGVARIAARGATDTAPVRSSYQVLWHRDGDGQWRIVRDVVSPY
jgi:uncharacterized protein (TIGR02246 family)